MLIPHFAAYDKTLFCRSKGPPASRQWHSWSSPRSQVANSQLFEYFLLLSIAAHVPRLHTVVFLLLANRRLNSTFTPRSNSTIFWDLHCVSFTPDPLYFTVSSISQAAAFLFFFFSPSPFSISHGWIPMLWCVMFCVWRNLAKFRCANSIISIPRFIFPASIWIDTEMHYWLMLRAITCPSFSE